MSLVIEDRTYFSGFCPCLYYNAVLGHLAHRELVDTEGAQSLFLCCRSLYIYRHGPEAQRWTPKES